MKQLDVYKKKLDVFLHSGIFLIVISNMTHIVENTNCYEMLRFIGSL